MARSGLFLLSAFVLLASQVVSGHWIYETVETPTANTSTATRIPKSWSPIFLTDLDTEIMRCNKNNGPAKETLTVNAGDEVVFRMREGDDYYHPGPAAMYLGVVPEGQTAATWDGSGQQWFKIKEWSTGNTTEELSPGWIWDQFEWPWQTYGSVTLHATIPPEVPSGEYLLRAESLSFAVAVYDPQWWISCAQIKVVNGGDGKPPLVAIPGHISADDPNLWANTYQPPVPFRVPGPDVWPPAL
ncbi:hypothetical protein NMY22_g2273 [Coprinellus aureogranulatus]|nr:hypothetical protein NMY22_g2273 [Coprinellus aureogranulatus]